ncbi:ABC transporter permease [Marinoscillum sp. 108]|uniref:ABC transporter permease n=1 Tax=Marinoscillum sp. 108 TaxID=2653151 RepID=UPI001358427C|nr:ABC transporter permease [Marinoscillum sp. 108]
MLIVRLILESFRFAWNALRMNILRTTLSLLGVTIGIFAIIAVFTLVDSLERSIKDSLNFLGTNNINVEKWPYGFGGGPYPWWKYMQRPYPTYDEYKFLRDNVKNAQGMSIFTVRGGVTAKYESSSSVDLDLLGVVHGHKDVYEIPIEKGRYFTPQEAEAGRNVVILGFRSVKELFPNQSPIGKSIKIKGLKYHVIGVIKEEGDGFLGAPSNDENIYMPYRSFLKIYYSGQRSGVESHITVKGLDKDIGLVELEAELRGLMRKKRSLKPKEEDTFALNRPEAIANFIGSTFDVIGLAGWVIGGFSILVGGFGIANIMFVSVRERTHIIGIQKSLGAKNYFILFQFLFESVFLSVIGGGVGILLVWLLSFVSLGSLDLVLSLSNIVLGLGVSAIIGMASGIIPAAMAARLDPVIAIRSQ